MNRDSFFAYIGMTAIVIGTALAAFNFYPLGPMVLIIGGYVWGYVGYLRQDIPLIITNAAATTFGILGILFNFL